MKLVDVLNRIRQLNQPVVSTNDVSALLNVELQHASKILSRLADSGEMLKISRGLWGIQGQVDPFKLSEILTAPFPSYISLQSALYHHGMISQIPAVIYVVSLARSKTLKTPVGGYSIHHIAPQLFNGYIQFGPKKIALATPEKALFDFVYFSRTKLRYFSALPELELPEDFNQEKLKDYIALIKNKKIASMIKKRLNDILCSYL